MKAGDNVNNLDHKRQWGRVAAADFLQASNIPTGRDS